MKEHLRNYFPERFENSETHSLAMKVSGLMGDYNLARHRSRCERIVLEVYQKSNELKLLAGAMRKFGCDFNLLRHTVCENCSGCNGGFDPDTKQIVICQNTIINKHKVMAIMMHEMIHMFDYCRAKFDFDNLDHVACSEVSVLTCKFYLFSLITTNLQLFPPPRTTKIRAANLTYCSISDRLAVGGPGLFDLKKTHQYCVKDVAFKSVKAYSPDTEDSKIWTIIDKVFPGCYNDLEPFGRRPINGSQEFRQSYRERYHYGYV